jgi:uncharacterized protein YkwD
VLRWGTRSLALLLCLGALAVAAAPVASSAPAAHTTSLTSLQSGVLDQLNLIRAQHGLTALKLSTALSASAAQHSREMGADGYFEHNSNDGTAFWKRIEHWYASSSYGYWSVGENLLWSSPDVDAKGALQLWMNSPEHRANILAPRWREIGISAVHVDAGGGTYQGLPVTIITTDFGVRH